MNMLKEDFSGAEGAERLASLRRAQRRRAHGGDLFGDGGEGALHRQGQAGAQSNGQIGDAKPCGDAQAQSFMKDIAKSMMYDNI